MCKYVMVITVIARQDVVCHFGTTLNLPALGGTTQSVRWHNLSILIVILEHFIDIVVLA